ncbi:MAG: transcription elongation factor subunit Spt4 [Promethearchaeota archaeon]
MAGDKERACRNCHLITRKPKCPQCGTYNLSENFSGIVIIFDAKNSEIAKAMNIKRPGKYALRVR